MTPHGLGPYLLALTGVAVVATATSLWLPALGLATSALLFLLPVLLVAARGGVGPGLVAAGAGALAYNYFLLPPRFTLRIHGFDNAVSVLVLVAVAVVTSRLATALKRREEEARVRAEASGEAAACAALLARGAMGEGIDIALEWLHGRYGQLRLIGQGNLPEEEAGLSTLDLSAAAWAMHNGDVTGHGTATMPASDWTFLPLAPGGQDGTDLLAVSRPADGTSRSGSALGQLSALARLIGQARDRLSLEQERQARERLEDRDALLRTMLASLAHDFRTPLTVVAGELDRLSRSDAGAASALAEARRLDRMMDDLIGAARIESGALAPHLEAVDLVDILADGCASLSALLEPLRITRDLPIDLPMAEADPVLLRHILINLLDNAARHAAGAIGVAGRAVNGHVELSVSDDGPGIPAHERDRIFERFVSIEGGDRRDGSGLGLAIVKGFADAMGMTIEVTETPGGGSTFRLAMPARTVRAP